MRVGKQREVVRLQAGAAVGQTFEGVFEGTSELVRRRQAGGARDAGERVGGPYRGEGGRALRRSLQLVPLGVERVEVLGGFGAVKLIERT